VPVVVDYPVVFSRMIGQRLGCNYPNSGSFGFAPQTDLKILGWIGPDDATIRPAMRQMARVIPAPHEFNLAAAALDAWQMALPGVLWAMPASHWHFELHDGSREYLPALLSEIDIDPAILRDRPDGSALEFTPSETAAFGRFLRGLLSGLRVSDFMLAFPARPVLCMVHHHKQLWWTSPEAGWLERIDRWRPGAGG
jgi:hypothetical protein